MTKKGLNNLLKEVELNNLLEQVVLNGFYVCECGNNVEADGSCVCGRINPIIGGEIE